ncbi:MAG: hypothetical protein ACTSWN_14150 [Promethearchaeota archaeon]
MKDLFYQYKEGIKEYFKDLFYQLLDKFGESKDKNDELWEFLKRVRGHPYLPVLTLYTVSIAAEKDENIRKGLKSILERLWDIYSLKPSPKEIEAFITSLESFDYKKAEKDIKRAHKQITKRIKKERDVLIEIKTGLNKLSTMHKEINDADADAILGAFQNNLEESIHNMFNIVEYGEIAPSSLKPGEYVCHKEPEEFTFLHRLYSMKTILMARITISLEKDFPPVIKVGNQAIGVIKGINNEIITFRGDAETVEKNIDEFIDNLLSQINEDDEDTLLTIIFTH